MGADVCAGEGRSELDELQEEVARRARQQELQRKKEKEREAAMGFNPKPSKFMDLDELQHQGKYHTVQATCQLHETVLLSGHRRKTFVRQTKRVTCLCGQLHNYWHRP